MTIEYTVGTAHGVVHVERHEVHQWLVDHPQCTITHAVPDRPDLDT